MGDTVGDNGGEGERRESAPPTVLLAASTGGSPAVQSILASLPQTLGCRVLVVQHLPRTFTGRFAERLNTRSELTVREASATGAVGPNEAVVARGGKHLEVTADDGENLQFVLTDDEPIHSVRPAADVTFHSTATTAESPLVGVVLSGMGADGAVGVEWVAAEGGTVIVQDPETASFPVMPENAIETGVVDETLPPEEIPDAIVEAAGRSN